MEFYIGRTPNEELGGLKRYYYALRRTDEGDLYFIKTDQLVSIDESITINVPGDPEDDFSEFEYDVDYFDGRDENHERPDANLYPDQFRWDDRNMYYFLNSEGELVVRINQGYTYPTDV